jgi:hypothetical protein
MILIEQFYLVFSFISNTMTELPPADLLPCEVTIKYLSSGEIAIPTG